MEQGGPGGFGDDFPIKFNKELQGTVQLDLEGLGVISELFLQGVPLWFSAKHTTPACFCFLPSRVAKIADRNLFCHLFKLRVVLRDSFARVSSRE